MDDPQSASSAVTMFNALNLVRLSAAHCFQSAAGIIVTKNCLFMSLEEADTLSPSDRGSQDQIELFYGDIIKGLVAPEVGYWKQCFRDVLLRVLIADVKCVPKFL
jgi:hypothetical protein